MTAARLLRGDMELQALTPEASARRYFRPLEACACGWLLARWSEPAPLAATEWMHAAGVRVPVIGPSVPGAYLVQDFGDCHLAQAPAPAHYASVLEQSERIGAAALPSGHPNARLSLDAELFRKELRMFREYYVQGLRRRAGAEAAALEQACARLAQAASAGPWRVQHRDLHSRNVMLPPDGGVALIDHQDLRPGPLFYDLASLRTDAYTDVPPAAEALLAQAESDLAQRARLQPQPARDQYHATALQRVLKALGTFGRLIGAGREHYREAERRARGHALRLLRARADFAEFLPYVE